jgi:cardiolipin synthase
MSSGFHKINRTKLIQGGAAYFNLLKEIIERATENIHIQTYILEDDETGRTIKEALKKAAARGVQIYILADGYASQSLHRSFIKDLIDHNIRFRFFEPVFRSKFFYFGRRLHHKVAVVDARYALVGGINISNRYNDIGGSEAWFDFALYAEGEIARELCVLCWKSWKGFPSFMQLTPCEKKAQIFEIPQEESCKVRMRRNDWVRRKNEISRTYIEMLKTAKEQVIIVSSYFLPGRTLQRNLVAAIKRGVKVKVVMAGMSDVQMAKNAERYMYDWLLRNKIEIYEFSRTILHAKIAVADDEWFTVGSYNVNNISAYASVELNLDVREKKAASETRAILEKVIGKDCVRITREKHLRTNNPFKQFVRWCSYQFIRIVFFLFTFYFKQQN